MRNALVAIALVSATSIGSSAAAQAPTTAPIFRFEADGFWLNLHHYLYVLGRAQNHTPDSQRRAVVNAPADQEAGLKGLRESHRQDWAGAVRFYAGGLSTMDAVFDQKLIAVTNAMRVSPNATAAALKIDPELRATLIGASQVYRLAFWPKHQAENHARVRDFAGQLEQHGSQVRDYVTRAYQLDWPKNGYLVNVSGYTNWAGAYSTAGDLIVVSSFDEGTAGSRHTAATRRPAACGSKQALAVSRPASTRIGSRISTAKAR